MGRPGQVDELGKMTNCGVRCLCGRESWLPCNHVSLSHYTTAATGFSIQSEHISAVSIIFQFMEGDSGKFSPQNSYLTEIDQRLFGLKEIQWRKLVSSLQTYAASVTHSTNRQKWQVKTGQACNNVMVSHPDQVIADGDVGQLFGTAYSRAATVNNDVKGFKACGIEPYNSQIFAEEDFAPSATTERDLKVEPSHDQPTIALSGQQPAIVENDLSLQHIIMEPGTSHLQHHLKVVPDEAENLTHISESNDNENIPKPTTISRGQVSLNSIKPFPVANSPSAAKRKRPKVSANILTSTPVKDVFLV
ncbi:hypothetical protein PR048_015662 [Dryococelus australis]|uniref:Uncharacterized protein n=1 Tax=Dryococelus australis TaxID=614101 RepID=A0ABQ9HHS5_9NEOP|nr:hypothetical protein PR048_015662 [Dryococelus australis]